KKQNFSDEFLKTYEVALDDKNRFSFPAEYRSVLFGKTLVITKGMDGCLYVFTEERYRKFCETQLSSNDGIEKKAIRKLKRVLTSSAVKKSIDNQGRLLLPQNLLRLVDIEKELVVVGTGDRIELWNKSKWEEEVSTFDDIEDLLEEL
ncbi:MAG TPA: division/cell wall cluster transcriptional repressor MraZ, partial [bacterium]|nr:division/cell wall cluster transcriptional repressor MraZ [bacterium]